MSGGPWDDRTIGCARCGSAYPARYLRCDQCEHLTSASREALEQHKPTGLMTVNWPVVLAIAAVLWAIIIAAIW